MSDEVKNKFCINCGKQHTLEVVVEPEEHCKPFLERGEYCPDENEHSDEQEVTVLKCSSCKQEQIAL